MTTEADERANDHLVAAWGEPRDPDDYVRAIQDDRDRQAARGDFERADALDQRVQELRHPTLDVPSQRDRPEPISLNREDLTVFDPTKPDGTRALNDAEWSKLSQQLTATASRESDRIPDQDDAAMREAARDRADRQDPDLARLANARDEQSAGGRFDLADASQRLINHLRTDAAVRGAQTAGLTDLHDRRAVDDRGQGLER